jgi:hypothetical protein
VRHLAAVLALVAAAGCGGDDPDFGAIERENTAEFNTAWSRIEDDARRDWCGHLAIVGVEEAGKTFAEVYPYEFADGDHDDVDDSLVGTWLLGDLIDRECF